MKTSYFRPIFSNSILFLCLSLGASNIVYAGTWYTVSTFASLDLVSTSYSTNFENNTVIVTGDSGLTLHGVWEATGHNYTGKSHFTQKVEGIIFNSLDFPPGTIVTATSLIARDEGGNSASGTTHFVWTYEGNVVFEADATFETTRMTLDN